MCLAAACGHDDGIHQLVMTMLGNRRAQKREEFRSEKRIPCDVLQTERRPLDDADVFEPDIEELLE